MLSVYYYDYLASREIDRVSCENDWPFYGMLMAVMRQADTHNAALLRRAFPDVWAELRARYNAPGGILDGEPMGN